MLKAIKYLVITLYGLALIVLALMLAGANTRDSGYYLSLLIEVAVVGGLIVIGLVQTERKAEFRRKFDLNDRRKKRLRKT